MFNGSVNEVTGRNKKKILFTDFYIYFNQDRVILSCNKEELAKNTFLCTLIFY